LNYVIAIGIFQALLAIILLFRKALRSKADALLLFLLLSMCTHLCIKFFIYNWVNDGHVRVQMNTFIGFCYTPLLYLYARKQEDERFIPASMWYLFLPFIAGAIGYLTVVCMLVLAPEEGYKVLALYNNSSTWLFIIADFIFPFLSLRIAFTRLQDKPSEQKLITGICYSFLFSGVVAVVFRIIHMEHIERYNLTCRTIIYGSLVVICLQIIRYKVLIARTGTSEIPDTLPPVPAFQEVSVTPALILNRTTEVMEEHAADMLLPDLQAGRKLLLTDEQHIALWEKLEAFLKSSKLYMDTELNLDKLAAASGINKYHLSETLNTYVGKSFYQYINEYRINHAIGQMQYFKEKDLPVNVLTIAYDSGFKAKSSFNQYFKKITGQTPTAYFRAMDLAFGGNG